MSDFDIFELIGFNPNENCPADSRIVPKKRKCLKTPFNDIIETLHFFSIKTQTWFKVFY